MKPWEKIYTNFEKISDVEKFKHLYDKITALSDENAIIRERLQNLEDRQN